MQQQCISCIRGRGPVLCQNCMVRGNIPGWDELPTCCKGCDYMDAKGVCMALRSVEGVKENLCGLRSSPRGIKDYSKLTEAESRGGGESNESG